MRIGQYDVGELLGKGEFGKVYKVQNVNTGRVAAMKIATGDDHSTQVQLLRHEGKMHSTLAGVRGVPQLKDCGKHGDHYYIVIPLLSHTLKDVAAREDGISGEVVLAIMETLLRILKQVHSRGLLHRDISPGNIMFSDEDCSQLVLCDFGFAMPYRVANQHIPQTSGNELIGTSAYASKPVRSGVRPSRRDDVESLAYTCWAAWLKGECPWTNTEREITQLRELCHVDDAVSHAMVDVIESVRKTAYRQSPDYDGILSLLRRTRLQLNRTT